MDEVKGWTFYGRSTLHPKSNPANSEALSSTSNENQERHNSPSVLQDNRRGCQLHADGEQDCFRSKCPRESRGIRRRKHDNLEGIGTNRSQYAMSTASPMYGWNTIRWRVIERTVWKLQKRIYQASSRGDGRTVRKPQKLLMKSRSAK